MIMIQDSLLTLLTKDEDRLMDSLWGFDCWVLAWVFFFYPSHSSVSTGPTVLQKKLLNSCCLSSLCLSDIYLLPMLQS